MVMRNLLRLLVGGAAVMAAGNSVARAATYDVVVDFKTKANQNGPWSFHGTQDGLLDYSTHNLFGHHGWRALANQEDYSNTYTYVAKNATGQPITQSTVVAPLHALAVVPGVSDTVFIEFTAPETGVYRLKIEVTGIQTNEESHDVAVVGRNRTLCEGTIAKYQQLFQCYKTVSLKQGEALILFNGMSQTQTNNVGVGVVFNVKGPVKSGV